MALVVDRRFAVRSRRNDGLDAARRQVIANIVAVIALVAEKPVGIDVMKLHERAIAFDLVSLSAGHIEGQRIAFGVRAEVDFGREPAARAAERVLVSRCVIASTSTLSWGFIPLRRTTSTPNSFVLRGPSSARAALQRSIFSLRPNSRSTSIEGRMAWEGSSVSKIRIAALTLA